jgi:hypothetical protein
MKASNNQPYCRGKAAYTLPHEDIWAPYSIRIVPRRKEHLARDGNQNTTDLGNRLRNSDLKI